MVGDMMDSIVGTVSADTNMFSGPPTHKETNESTFKEVEEREKTKA